jgi:hypothetical protein
VKRPFSLPLPDFRDRRLEPEILLFRSGTSVNQEGQSLGAVTDLGHPKQFGGREPRFILLSAICQPNPDSSANGNILGNGYSAAVGRYTLLRNG